MSVGVGGGIDLKKEVGAIACLPTVYPQYGSVLEVKGLHETVVL
jgi:hypothetical protein